MSGPLAGVKVIELGALIAAPLAGGILADQGAEVIKLEPPGAGDLMRHVGSSRGGMSGLFHVINRGKRSLALNLSDERGKDVLRELVRRSDALVQNLRPGVVERMGLGWDDLRALNPNLVYLSLSGFGRTGPYAHKRVYDNVIQTYSGIADAQSDPHSGEPGFVRQLLTDKLTAYAGAQAVCAALLAAARGRGGQQVELSMLDTAIAFLFFDAAADRILQGDGIAAQPGLGSGFALTRLADGFGTFTPFSDAEFQAACRALDAPELAADPELATTAKRMGNYARWMEAIAVLRRNAARLAGTEFEARLDAHDVPHGVVRKLEELHLDPQVIASGVFVERDHPQAGRVREPRPPAYFRGTPSALGAPAPALGQHTREILVELGWGARESELRAAGVVA